jgi:hypothetical protein
MHIIGLLRLIEDDKSLGRLRMHIYQVQQKRWWYKSFCNALRKQRRQTLQQKNYHDAGIILAKVQLVLALMAGPCRLEPDDR